jgi:hypothetical protein
MCISDFKIIKIPIILRFSGDVDGAVQGDDNDVHDDYFK